VPIERPTTVEEILDELRLRRLTLVALRAQQDGEVARAYLDVAFLHLRAVLGESTERRSPEDRIE
jgi:hypothetical protein